MGIPGANAQHGAIITGRWMGRPSASPFSIIHKIPAIPPGGTCGITGCSRPTLSGSMISKSLPIKPRATSRSPPEKARPSATAFTCTKAMTPRPKSPTNISNTSNRNKMCSLDSFCGLIEFVPGFTPRPQISHVLFDFDGTLSLIREGWPEVMTPMFVEMLPPLDDESAETRQQLCREDIMRRNGKQTIYQIIQLTERINERGGIPRDPLWSK